MFKFLIFCLKKFEMEKFNWKLSNTRVIPLVILSIYMLTNFVFVFIFIQLNYKTNVCYFLLFNNLLKEYPFPIHHLNLVHTNFIHIIYMLMTFHQNYSNQRPFKRSETQTDDIKNNGKWRSGIKFINNSISQISHKSTKYSRN